jgi:hypothetical protein
VQPGVHFLIPRCQTLPARVAFVKEILRGGPLPDPSHVKISLSSVHVVLQNSAAVCQHSGFKPGRRLTALRTIEIEENFRWQEIVPEAEKGGIPAAFAKAALVHAHGLIFRGSSEGVIARVGSRYYFFAIMTITLDQMQNLIWK